MSANTFTSSKGAVLTLRAVSQFKIDTLRASQEVVPIPTYEAKTVGGEVQLIAMDETIAKNQGRLQEWNDYLKRKKDSDALQAKRFLELLVWEGVDVEVPGPESDWQKSNEYFGLQIPDNPIERKLFYVYHEMIGTEQDVGDLVSEILSVSQVNEEAVRILRNSFRNGVQRKAPGKLPKKKRALENKKPDVQ